MTQLDPAAAMTAALAIVFGPQIASIAGPYAVIIVGACVGAAWSLGRRPVTSRSNAFGYFTLMCFTAVMCTVPAAEGLGRWLGVEDAQRLFAPVAMMIGGVGADWPRLLKWAGRRAVRLIERRNGGSSND